MKLQAIINGILQNLGDQQIYNPNLSFVYWIPKFHKVPTGFRLITSGRNTCINGLSKILSTALNVFWMLLKDIVIKYISLITSKTILLQIVIKIFLIIQTLYTNIPQDKLNESLEEFIKYVFQVKESKYIYIHNKYAVFSNTKSVKFSCTEVELIRYLNYIIDNTFV